MRRMELVKGRQYTCDIGTFTIEDIVAVPSLRGSDRRVVRGHWDDGRQREYSDWVAAYLLGDLPPRPSQRILSATPDPLIPAQSRPTEPTKKAPNCWHCFAKLEAPVAWLCPSCKWATCSCDCCQPPMSYDWYTDSYRKNEPVCQEQIVRLQYSEYLERVKEWASRLRFHSDASISSI
jgi:hypothetical protein